MPRANKPILRTHSWLVVMSALLIALMIAIPALASDDIDFDKLNQKTRAFVVELKLQIEFSYGMQRNEQEERVPGTIVTEDGLVLFDGSFIADDNPLSPMSSFAFRTTPTRIEVITMAGEKYDAAYLGVDQHTGIAFARINGAGDTQFEPVKFRKGKRFEVGQWLACQTLLPDFVSPKLAVDVGMLSALVEEPEEFPLAVGFSSFERAAVLFDTDLDAVGVLGVLSDPGEGLDTMMDPFAEMEFPLLGVITADRVLELIEDPPIKGKVDRAWLGITLQAMTPDIAGFLGSDVTSGIIVNEVVPSSPAETCGLQIGDIIYEINGQPVQVDREEEISIFQRQIAQMGAGASAEFSVLRPTDTGVDSLVLLAVLEAAPLAAADAPEFEDERLEFKARDLVFSDFQVFNIQQSSITGVVVTELREGGLANIYGLQIGDVIQQVNGTAVETVDDLAEVIERLSESVPSEVVFFVWRFGQTMFVNVKTT